MPRGFEGYVEKKVFGEQLITHAHERAREVLARDVISMDEFIDVYGVDEIESDKRYVDDMRSKFAEPTDAERYGEILEAIIGDQIERSGWLGINVKTKKTSPYDDIYSGIDTIAELRDAETRSPIGLAIDVSFSRSSLNKKFARIKDEINQGKLPEVKYYERAGERGKIQMPRIIIGADFRTVQNLTELWMDKDRSRELANHPIRQKMLLEAIHQLSAFKRYAEDQGQTHLVTTYAQIQKRIERILVKISHRKIEDVELKKDSLFLDILHEIKNQFGEASRKAA